MAARRRRPAVALFLSLISLGLGQLYNQEPRKTVLFIASWVLAVVLLMFLLGTFPGGVFALVIGVSLKFACLVDAYRSARSKNEVELQWYNRWYVYLGFFAIFTFATSEFREFYHDRFFITSFIPSAAMEPTLLVGDYIMSERIDLTKTPLDRGDIVIFTLTDKPDTRLIKRVIALPGERVAVRGTTVLINGRPLTEDYARWIDGGKKDFSEQVVPEGTMFVLGDNRDYSLDSRFWNIPFLPIERILAKPLYIYFSKQLLWERVGKQL